MVFVDHYTQYLYHQINLISINLNMLQIHQDNIIHHNHPFYFISNYHHKNYLLCNKIYLYRVSCYLTCSLHILYLFSMFIGHRLVVVLLGRMGTCLGVRLLLCLVRIDLECFCNLMLLLIGLILLSFGLLQIIFNFFIRLILLLLDCQELLHLLLKQHQLVLHFEFWLSLHEPHLLFHL